MMAARHERMYRDTPRMERGDDGKMRVAKADAKKGETRTDTKDMPLRHAHERREMHHRHVHEKLAMHHRHEMEHGTHKGDKRALHDRHEREHEEMHTRHEREMKTLHDRHEKEMAAGPSDGAVPDAGIEDAAATAGANPAAPAASASGE